MQQSAVRDAMESELVESSVSGDYGDCESSPSEIDTPSDCETEPVQKKQKLTSKTRKLSGSKVISTVQGFS